MRPHRHHDRDDDARLTALAADVRRAYADAPDGATAARHLAAMAAVTPDAQPATASRRPARVRRGLAAATAGVAGALLATSGLAVAGVSLPDPVNAPFDAVGVTLPNQAEPEAEPARTVTMPASPPARTTETTPERARAAKRAERLQRVRERARDRREAPGVAGGRSRGQGEDRRARPIKPSRPVPPPGTAPKGSSGRSDAAPGRTRVPVPRSGLERPRTGDRASRRRVPAPPVQAPPAESGTAAPDEPLTAPDATAPETA